MIPATAFTILFALWCAHDDAQQIARHSKIYHGLQWTFRAALVVAVCYWWASWWLALGMAGLFSAVFRWDLNGRRGMDWRYVSPSSWYDWQFIRWTPFFRGPNRVGRKVSASFMARVYAINEHLQASIHRAGTMAYIFEAVVFVGVVVAYLCRTELAQRLAT